MTDPRPPKPMHSFRIRDDIWHAAKERAHAEGTTLNAVLVRYLTRYAKGGKVRRDEGEK